MNNKLKIVTTEITEDNNIIFIISDGSTSSYNGETPVLAYNSEYNSEQILYVLDKGGSPENGLVTCSSLKKILDKYLFKGTKFIISTYNPTLYYLTPGISENDALFTSDTDFIPTLPISKLVRLEVDGFDKNFEVKQGDIKSIKYCDSWFNDLSKYEDIVEAIEGRVESVFGYYKSYDIKKEVKEETGSYSADVHGESIVVSLLSGTTYTDTINLEDWVLKSKKGSYPVSGKLDISYMYSIGEVMYGGMQTIKAFQYEENVTSNNVIINFGDLALVQLEYMNYILKIYPLSDDIDEVVFTDCTLTIGCL